MVNNKMEIPQSCCPHINIIGDCTKEDIIKRKESSECYSCENHGPHLYICLYRECLYVGCSDSSGNHWLSHYQETNEHSIFLNMTTMRVVCLICDEEVFLENNDPPLPGLITTYQKLCKHVHETDSEDDMETEDENLKPRGLTGLQNMGNTCYMNSAIQALSNVPQLTYFFLECSSFVRSEKKPGLSKSYMRLVQEMWHKRRPSYVVPSSIAYGIRMVFPVFRGYMQQDAQEFLRYFLDQLHEELKEPVVEIPNVASSHEEDQDDFDGCPVDSAATVSDDSSQSEAEFETCDSGLSSEKSSCASDDNCIDHFSSENRDGSQKLCVIHGSYCSQHLVRQGNRSKSLEMDKEMKDCTNLAQQHAEGSSPSVSNDIFDSGLPSSRTDFSEVNTLSEVKTPDRTCKFECGDHKKCNLTEFYGKQSLSSQGQLQRRSISPHSTLSNNASHSNKRKKMGHFQSIISDTFDGKILSSVQCLTCNTLSTTRETFQDLSLPIPSRDHLHVIHASHVGHNKGAPGTSSVCADVYNRQGWFTWFFGWIFSWFWGPAVSLQDCLSAFFSADELKGDNMYSCEKCKKLRNGIKYSRVLELPEVLCIHLKRFRHEVLFSSKLSSYVSFPLYGLDMSNFLQHSYHSGVLIYDLAAVICHHGTAGSGHYTTYALNCLNEQWYEFDDQYVTAVDPQVVLNCEAYVLFYRKSTDEIIKKRQRAVELMELSKSEHGLLQFHISKQWVNKFNTFAEPGPITNTDFLCVHGGVPPSRSSYVEEMCTILPQAVWEYLHDTFGGGPSCTHLYVCPICQSEQKALVLRKKTEQDHFVEMNSSFYAEDSPALVYAISVSWFKLWENFVRNKDCNEPPGPIDNSSICYVKGNQSLLKLGSVYGSLSEEMWKYFHRIYGGGPEIQLPSNVNSSSTSASSSRQHSNSQSSSKSSSSTNHVAPRDDTQKYNQIPNTDGQECELTLISDTTNSSSTPGHGKTTKIEQTDNQQAFNQNCTHPRLTRAQSQSIEGMDEL